MNKEETAVEKAKKVLGDFKRTYNENTIKVFSPEKLKEWGTYKYLFDVWKVFIDVPDEQFGGESPFCIAIKDETMEPFMFHDGGAPGRVPELEIIKKNGNYSIGDVWVNK